MRDRRRILTSLETAYQEAFERARERADEDEMARLDLDFQRDQIQLEALLDVRDLLIGAYETSPPKEAKEAKEGKSILEEGTAMIEKAGALRRIIRLR